MNLNYLNYAFHKHKYLYLLLLILFIVVFPVLNLFVNNQNKAILLDIIYIPTVLYISLAYVLPIWDFKQYYFKNVANIYFSLPDSRANIYRTTTYMHLFFCVLIYSIAITLGILVLYLKQVILNYGYLFAYLGLIDLIFVSVYFFQSFIASRAYNLRDAIALSLAYLALPAALILVAYFGLRSEELLVDWSKISFIGQTDKMTKYFVQYAFNRFGQNFDNYLALFLGFGICVILHIMTIYRVNRLKPELIGEKTDSVFAYKILQPIYLFLILLLGNYEVGYLALIINLTLIVVYVAYTYFKYQHFRMNYYILLEYVIFLGITSLLAYLI